MGFLTTTDTSKKAAPLELTARAKTDLMLDSYLDKVFESRHGSGRLDWSQFLTADPEDLIYRREVLTELSANPHLVESIENVCKTLSQIHQLLEMPASDEFYAENIREFSVLPLAHSTMSRLSEELNGLIAAGTVKSRGLIKLADVVGEKVRTTFTKDFDKHWKELAGGIDQMGSVRIRFTLDGDMRIQGAALTQVDSQRFVKNSLFSGTMKENRQKEKPWNLEPLKDMKTPAEELLQVQLSNNQKEFLQVLTKITRDLDDLYQDLSFYLGALLYLRQMKKTGTPVCWPQIRPKEEKAFTAVQMYNPVLTVFKKGGTVPNDIDFKKDGEILILTGINQGGKTTFLRTVGVLQAIFQLGWPVSAQSASLSPVDRIVTVFSHEENTNLEHGKLGQELETLRAGLDLATPYSLLLFNEPITGTSPMENLFLSREVLSACKLQGYKGVWVTHIYDLASGADEMNKELSGSCISSIIAIAEKGADGIQASYRIQRGAPQFTSYAKEVLFKETGAF